MDRVSENSSFIAVTSYPSFEFGSRGELEIANQWLEKSIEKEIRRGAKLREEKLFKLESGESTNGSSSSSSLSRTLKLAGDNNRIPSNSAKDLELEKLRGRARSISPLQKSPLSREHRSASCARAARPVCSRISELAAPSKRQVIDTWRSKAAVLPEFRDTRNKAIKAEAGGGPDCNENELDVLLVSADQNHQDKHWLGSRSTQVGKSFTVCEPPAISSNIGQNNYSKRESNDMKTGENEDMRHTREKLTVELLQKESRLKGLQIMNMERDNYLKDLQCLEFELRYGLTRSQFTKKFGNCTVHPDTVSTENK